jgi:hypothetical protein
MHIEFEGGSHGLLQDNHPGTCMETIRKATDRNYNRDKSQ